MGTGVLTDTSSSGPYIMDMGLSEVYTGMGIKVV